MKNEQTSITRHLPPQVLEILSQTTGARCHEVRGALALADVVFRRLHAESTGAAICVDCADLEQRPCPNQNEAVAVLIGQLALIGVTGRSSGGYDQGLANVAAALQRDRKEFGSRKPRKRPTKVPNTPT